MNEKQIAQLKSLVENKQLAALTDEIHQLVEVIKSAPKTQIVTQVPASINMDNFVPAPEAVTIKNIGDIKIPENVTIKNIDEFKFPKEIAINNLPEVKEVQKVEIINHAEQKDNTPFFKGLIIKATDALAETFKTLWAQGISFKQNTAKTPLYVIHVDQKGAPIGSPSMQVFGGGGGSSTQTPSVPKHGKATVVTAGTPVALAGATSKVKKVTIQASFNNVGYIWVGDSSVSASAGEGIPLLQGASITIELSNLANLFLDADNSGDLVTYIALS